MKKRGRPATTGPGTLVSLRLQPEEMARVDAWIAQQPNTRISRSEAVRRLARDGLSGGFPKLVRLTLDASRYREFMRWAEGMAIPKERFISTRDDAGRLLYDVLQLCWDSEEAMLVAETWCA